VYEKFYNLNQNPFSLAPDPEFICMTEQHREALSGLIYSVCTRPGLTLLVGEVGTGKTTLLYTLLNFLEKKQYRTALCCNPLLSSAEFYDYLLASLDVPCASSLKSQHLIALQDSLSRNLALGKPSVLIVDEAQKLSVELLEEIRLLTNIETPRHKLLQSIIAGQP
jgi:general secretion pathway protein A